MPRLGVRLHDDGSTRCSTTSSALLSLCRMGSLRRDFPPLFGCIYPLDGIAIWRDIPTYSRHVHFTLAVGPPRPGGGHHARPSSQIRPSSMPDGSRDTPDFR